MPNYILVTSDADGSDGDRRTAREIASMRLQERRWPIYGRTRFRKDLLVGDRLLFYIGGSKKDAHSFVATAGITDIERVNSMRLSLGTDPLRQRLVWSWLKLSEPMDLTPPVAVAPLLSKLSFIPSNRTSWGVAFMGGARRIEDADWNLVLESKVQVFPIRRRQCAASSK